MLVLIRAMEGLLDQAFGEVVEWGVERRPSLKVSDTKYNIKL